MEANEERDLNQAAFRRLKPDIDRTYPFGRFVAIHHGKVVADGATFEELDDALNESGLTSRNILVIQAGVDYPEFIWIFLQGATPSGSPQR
jgi:hypothetical protein